MRPKLPDGYSVYYRYGTVISKRPPRKGEHCIATMRVTANVCREADQTVVATGEAILSPRDQFSRRIGRDISLGRALRQLAIVLAMSDPDVLEGTDLKRFLLRETSPQDALHRGREGLRIPERDLEPIDAKVAMDRLDAAAEKNEPGARELKRMLADDRR